MSISHNDQQLLWWLLEQHLWTVGDLVRFGKYTEVLSDLDATLLIKLNHRMEQLVKKGRQDHAVSKPKAKRVLPEAAGEAHNVGKELPHPRDKD